VQKYVQDPLADAILRGDVKDGQTVPIEEGDGALVLGTENQRQAA
jgi:ATP-dependent Clp protease ATP-binding subunit ClpB